LDAEMRGNLVRSGSTKKNATTCPSADTAYGLGIAGTERSEEQRDREHPPHARTVDQPDR
jgi:hypothetical protein